MQQQTDSQKQGNEKPVLTTGEAWLSRRYDTPLPIAPLRPRAKRLPRGTVVLVVLVLVALAIAIAVLMPILLEAQSVSLSTAPGLLASSATARGQLSFLSSGHQDASGNQGASDIVSLDLHALATPSAGQQYDAWLLSDQPEGGVPLLLGTLPVVAGFAHLTYTTPQHVDLLATYSRFLVTEQASHTLPLAPSLDPATWRYEGSIPSIPTPGDTHGYSLLSHLRHLLARDPTLQQIGLSGGLDTWLYQNAGKVLEWVKGAHYDWSVGNVAQMRRQIDRVVEYLDGSAYAGEDLPSGTPWLVDPKAGRLGLLERSPAEEPPGYLAHVDLHLNGLIHAPGVTADQKRLAIQIDMALSRVTILMQHCLQDAVQLAHMSDTELEQTQALELVDDMATEANDAYAGQSGSMGTAQSGIAWIHSHISFLATIPITPVSQVH